MIKFFLSAFTLISFNCFAQEAVVEVGKHANANLDAVSMIMSLLMVLVLIFISAWVLKKFNVVNKTSTGMKVITSLPVGSKEKVIVIQVGEEQLLLGVSAQQVTLLKILDKPLEVATPINLDLSQKFGQFLNKSNTQK